MTTIYLSLFLTHSSLSPLPSRSLRQGEPSQPLTPATHFSLCVSLRLSFQLLNPSLVYLVSGCESKVHANSHFGSSSPPSPSELIKSHSVTQCATLVSAARSVSRLSCLRVLLSFGSLLWG
ncbi:uncharacterized protein LOC114751850 [Neltuma alba]|uniref:uncharacterized protein LOC114751850 n=1 Tax=Neltuma alba TaxID=207710 RepID=UPI0010A48375|nr:uncharacterized protein LOC114751850 [Prosopis alba]